MNGNVSDSSPRGSRGIRGLQGRGGNIVLTDGLFGETDDIVAGYWLVEARDYDEVVQLASDCPHLEFGSLEVRPVEAS